MGSETGTSVATTHAVLDRMDALRRRVRDIRGQTPPKTEILEMAVAALEAQDDAYFEAEEE